MYIITNLQADVDSYNDLKLYGVKIIPTFHFQNHKFIEKLIKLKSMVHYAIIMADPKMFDTSYRMCKIVSDMGIDV